MTAKKQTRRAQKRVRVSPSIQTLALNLRRFRALRGLSQVALAAMAEIDYKHYQKLEGGSWPGVRLETVERLAQALEVSVALLLTEVTD